jgi:hypothetical protein
VKVYKAEGLTWNVVSLKISQQSSNTQPYCQTQQWRHKPAQNVRHSRTDLSSVDVFERHAAPDEVQMADTWTQFGHCDMSPVNTEHVYKIYTVPAPMLHGRCKADVLTDILYFMYVYNVCGKVHLTKGHKVPEGQ